MTDIKSAIKDLSEFCNNGCDNEYIEDTICGMCKNPCEKGMSIITAVRSLQSWSEVLNALEEKKDVYKLVPISSTAMGKAYTYDESTICMAIDIINQHLAEIEK